MSPRRAMTMLAASTSALLLMLTSGGVANAVNPETANRKPDQDAGHFLGYPTPTYSWHGCTKTSTHKTPTPLPPTAPGTPRGNKQSKVSWTVEDSASADSGWLIRWEVKKGWKICGVQAAVLGTNPTVDSDWVMEAGYTSGVGKGSTVKSGGETIKVKISKHEAQVNGLPRDMGGKKFAITAIYGIAVFIKKK